jgi:hypothetical protein
MKQVINKQEQYFSVSWQQFRNSYMALDTVTDRGAPEVRLLHSIFLKYSSILLSNSTFLCLLMVPGQL